ncbi:MAG: response regulator [Ottowia sp.]|uniref:response regulator transcription factor n=1 Tax=Ottowia sp. TaxID=1898956 RepID=UPI003C7110E8
MSNNEVQPPHILIIDDDPDQLRLLVAALRNTPYRVSVALNGDQGYARATVLLPDLILLDVRMPGRNGITIARLLKTNPSTQHIPILILSALNDERERLAGLRAGAVDFISKPFYVDEVLERTRIHLALAQRKTLPALDETATDQSQGEAYSSNPLPTNLMLKQVATEFILNHIHDTSLKSSDVASNMEVSLRRLNAVFESSDGISVFEFIRQERMRRAALMLGQSTLGIADISIEVGYANPANFATEFKKFWGKSPTQLRSESQTNPDSLQQLISVKFN